MTMRKVDTDAYIPKDATTDWFVECDEPGCTSVLDAPQRTFSQVVELLKAHKWRAYKVVSDWRHRCPECQGKGGAS